MEILLQSIVDRLKKQVAEEIISKLYNSSKFVYSAEGQPSLLVDGGYLTELLKEYQNEK